jgi:hypothetical protein
MFKVHGAIVLMSLVYCPHNLPEYKHRHKGSYQLSTLLHNSVGFPAELEVYDGRIDL